jgi:hypothetical protein
VGAGVGHGGEAFQIRLPTGCIYMAGRALYVWDVPYRDARWVVDEFKVYLLLLHLFTFCPVIIELRKQTIG